MWDVIGWQVDDTANGCLVLTGLALPLLFYGLLRYDRVLEIQGYAGLKTVQEYVFRTHFALAST